MSSEEKETLAGRPAEPHRSTDPIAAVVPDTRSAKADDTTALREGEIIGERFRVTALLGAGGQGEVWRAEDLDITGHVVALKLLFERASTREERDMQLRELRMLASVSHPAVVQFKEHGWLGGRLWFVMPFLAGKSLEDAMPIGRPEARRVFETLAGGLAAVHAKGLRHQDIKPSNIFLAEIEGLDEPMPILLDFGVAAKEGEVLVAGSPNYFAPELAGSWPSPEHIGPEADVFSLALTLRNALDPDTAPTLDAFDPVSLVRRGRELIEAPKHAEFRFLGPSFARWLAIEPEKRPTAAEFRRELEILTGPEDRRRERARVMRRVAPWAAAALVIASVGSYWGWSELIAARKATATEALASDEARRQADAAETRASTLGSRLDEALDRADESARRSEDALGRLDDAEAAIGLAEGSAEAMRAARDRLRAALADARREIVAQSAALSEAHDSVSRLNSELEGVRAELSSARHDLSATRRVLGERDAELATMSTNLEAARAERDARAADLTSARARVSELEGRASSLETAIARAERERDEASAGATTLEAARRAAESALRAETERAGRLDARVVELQAQVRALERELETARSRGGAAGASSGGASSGGVIHGGPIIGGGGPIGGGVEVTPAP